MATHTEYDVVIGKGKKVACVCTSGTLGTLHPVGVILAHGAGGDLTSGNLPKIAETLAQNGYCCIRFTCKPVRLPYRVKTCQAVVDDAATKPELASVSRWVFAGHSMGARVASDMAQNNSNPDVSVLGCIFFSYPLHAADNQDALRDKPLVDLTCPVLFVRGSKDPMSKAEIFKSTFERMSAAQVEVHTVEGGNHSLAVPGGKQKVQEALEAALAAVCKFLSQLRENVQDEQPQASPEQRTDKKGNAQERRAAKHTAQEPDNVGTAGSGRRKRAKLSA